MPLDLNAMKPGNVFPNDADERAAIENLTQHIRALWHHVERLEHAITIENKVIKIRIGDASIVLKGDGTVAIYGKEFAVEGSGRIKLKASSDLNLESGGKINVESSGKIKVVAKDDVAIDGRKILLNGAIPQPTVGTVDIRLTHGPAKKP
jgi:hypothetical protein